MAIRRPAETFAPGEFLQEELEVRSWTQADLAEILGRPRTLITQIVNAKRRITPETANGLAAALGTSPEYWLNLESAYQLSKVKKEERVVERRAMLYERAPVRDLVKRHWIEPSDNIDVLESSVLSFIGTERVDEEPAFPFAARKSTSYHAVHPSQHAWLMRAKQLAETMPTKPYSHSKLAQALEQLKGLATSEKEVRRVPPILSEAGIRFLIVEHLQGTKIDGACFWLGKTEPVVVMSMRYDRIDYFWHTLMHELGHVGAKDGLDNSNLPFDVDMNKQNGDKPDYENEADHFAAEALIPDDILNDFIVRVGPLYSMVRIKGFANKNELHPGIVVGQLQHRGELQWSQLRSLLVPVRELITQATLTDGWGHVLPSM